MRERSIAAGATAALGVYNLIQNLLVRDRGYVPANLAISAGLVAVARGAGHDWNDLGLSTGRLEAGARLGMIAAGTTVAVTAAALAHPRSRPYLRDERAAGHSTSEVVFRAAVRFPLGTALFEEVAFRGVLTALWRRATPRWGGAVSAAAFGLWHILPTWRAISGNPAGHDLSMTRKVGATIGGVALTAAAGLLLQTLRDRSGGLVAPWLAHATLNSSSFVAGTAAWRVSSE